MKTQDKDSMTINWLDKKSAKRISLWSVIFLGIIWVLAPLLDRPVTQPILNEWVMNGSGLASFPIWGYSLLIRLLGSVNTVVILQSVIGAFATAALFVRLNCMVPRAKNLTTILFVLALPWFSFMAYAYQMPISSAFMILSLLALEMAISSDRISWGIAAGILGALGQNFRSELLLLPGAILVIVLILRRLQLFKIQSIKPLVIAAGVALLLQMPWALNCYFNAGRFSLTESNFGHVAFIGLGKIPSNPWNIKPSDGFAQETVTKAGLNCSSLSFQGSDFLKRRFIDDVKKYPVAYFRCLGARMMGTVYYPFGYVTLSPYNPLEEQAVRSLVGLNNRSATSTVISETEPISQTITKIKVGGMVFYEISRRILIRAISILGIIGFFFAMRIGPFRMNQPLILCLSIVVLYRFGLNVALYDAGKYMTSVYLCYIPFAINTLWFVYEKWLHFRENRNTINSLA